VSCVNECCSAKDKTWMALSSPRIDPTNVKHASCCWHVSHTHTHTHKHTHTHNSYHVRELVCVQWCVRVHVRVCAARQREEGCATLRSLT
jgi:hypothetical protein